jgi:hypothetical protein
MQKRVRIHFRLRPIKQTRVWVNERYRLQMDKENNQNASK